MADSISNKRKTYAAREYPAWHQANTNIPRNIQPVASPPIPAVASSPRSSESSLPPSPQTLYERGIKHLNVDRKAALISIETAAKQGHGDAAYWLYMSGKYDQSWLYLA